MNLEDTAEPPAFARNVPVSMARKRVPNDRRIIESVDLQLTSPDWVLALAKERVATEDVE